LQRLNEEILTESEEETVDLDDIIDAYQPNIDVDIEEENEAEVEKGTRVAVE